MFSTTVTLTPLLMINSIKSRTRSISSTNVKIKRPRKNGLISSSSRYFVIVFFHRNLMQFMLVRLRNFVKQKPNAQQTNFLQETSFATRFYLTSLAGWLNMSPCNLTTSNAF